MAALRFIDRLKRSIAKKIVRFIKKHYDQPIEKEYLTIEQAAAFFIEFDKRLAALEAKIVSSKT